MNRLTIAVENAISEATGSNFGWKDSHSVSGGCIHNASQVKGTDGRTFFLKTNRAELLDVFQAEELALREIARTKAIPVPQPVACSTEDDTAFLVLEFLSFGSAHRESSHQMGRQLARLHRTSHAKFGWPKDNFIGSSPQINVFESSWPVFYREKRLLPQIKRARNNGWKDTRIDSLLDNLEAFFHDYQPQPSLLHGDLWGGNAAFLEDGTPVVFDPASYYGDRETDIAFSTFFGGFSADFYRGYEEEWPLHADYGKRRPLYNLYHALNHFNLFGGSYGNQASQLIREALRAVL